MKNVGEYILIKEVGQGSLGKTWLAEHVLLKRKAAIKFLLPSLAKDLERFRSEIVELSSFRHPHWVGIQNAGIYEGEFYIVYDWVGKEHVPALSLSSWLEKDLSDEKIYETFRQIAAALDAIQEGGSQKEPLGLKWNNILLTEEESHVFLSDLGLNRLLSPGAWLSHLYQKIFLNMQDGSREESFWQSFATLAPEQKRIEAKINPLAVDVYAFGVILYSVLTKKMPEGWFSPPSIVRDTSKYDWDFVCKQCLHIEAEKRPQRLLPLMESILSRTAKFQIPAEEAMVALCSEPALAKQGESAFKLQLKPREIQRPQFEPDPGAIFQTESVVMRYQPAAREEKNIEPLLTEMVIIPGGVFYRGSQQGSRDEGPCHQVRLDPFALDIHPVTNEQFVRFLEAMGGEKDGNNNDMVRLRESRIKRSGGKLNIESGYARHPVVGVTWYGASAYAKWVGKRLPSEAEWEVAASGGIQGSLYPTGDNIERSHANFFSSDTTPVGSYPSNSFGLYDMAGNVYEWCQDWYDYHYYDLSVQEPDNPKGPMQGVYRVLRGGCWKSLKEDLRCAHRHRNNPGTMNGTYGFRCAADVAVD